MLILGHLPPRVSIFWQSRVRHASRSSKALKQISPFRKTASDSFKASFVGFDVESTRPLSLPIQAPTDSESHSSPRTSNPPKLPGTRKPSLFAVLFPEEVQKNATSKALGETTNAKIPPLPLPTVQELLESFENHKPLQVSHPREITKAASSDAYKHRKIAVLVLQVASKSLVENDFRRIAPKGMHIGEWTGPGDILTVFPARDPVTFEQTDHYFIVFANPAYARAYQSNVLRLYRIARQHTPTSIDSPLPLQRGVKMNREDVYEMLQDFTLCPPSQRLQLLYLYAMLSPGMRRLLSQGGYLGLPDGTDRAGRAVLFWIDGYQPDSREINSIIASDGRERGMAWNVSMEKLDVSAGSADPTEELEIGDTLETEIGSRRRAPQKWLLTFDNESEARRFIRAWHRKNLSPIRTDEPRIVHVEFLW